MDEFDGSQAEINITEFQFCFYDMPVDFVITFNPSF